MDMQREYVGRKGNILARLTQHQSNEVVSFNTLCNLFGLSDDLYENNRCDALYFILGFQIDTTRSLWGSEDDEQLDKAVGQYLPNAKYTRDQLVYEFNGPTPQAKLFDGPLTYGNLVTLFERECQNAMERQLELNQKSAGEQPRPETFQSDFDDQDLPF